MDFKKIAYALAMGFAGALVYDFAKNRVDFIAKLTAKSA